MISSHLLFYQNYNPAYHGRDKVVEKMVLLSIFVLEYIFMGLFDESDSICKK